jgi:hypothetical protein
MISGVLPLPCPRHRTGDRCFAASESFQFFALVSSFSVGFDGFDKSGALIFNNAPRPQISRSSQKPTVWQDSHLLSNSKGVALKSEDSAISSLTNKSFRISIAHPILSLISFSRIFGGGLIEEDEWRRYG